MLTPFPIVGYACTCPNNCDHHAGSSCKYYSGPSDNSPIIEGSKQAITNALILVEITEPKTDVISSLCGPKRFDLCCLEVEGSLLMGR